MSKETNAFKCYEDDCELLVLLAFSPKRPFLESLSRSGADVMILKNIFAEKFVEKIGVFAQTMYC
jgi:hypothetical protein